MNWKTIIYIFCLFLLCLPNFLYKITNKITLIQVLLYGLIFSTILYLTYDLVNNEKESMETKMDFQINDSNKLVNAIQSMFGYKEPEIKINNDYGQGLVFDKIATDAPKPFGPIAPIDNIDTTILTPKPSEEVIEKTHNAYEAAYRKMLEPSKPTVLYNEEGCMANYRDEGPCCDQVGVTASFNRTCPKSKPICVNYLAEDNNWGECISSGGGKENPVVVLGDYNMKPWSLTDNWLDPDAKWIWFTPKANLSSTPNSCAVFQYMSFIENPINIDLYIACGQQCYIIIENSLTRKTTRISQEKTSNKAALHKITLDDGVNLMYFHCYNTGFENNPAGLIVSARHHDKILFHSDDTWTWFQSLPLMDSVIFDLSMTYTPVVALWNKKHQGFLKMNTDGTVDVLSSPNKKLNNTFECFGSIFLYQKQRVNSDTGSNTISLYNCANMKYLSMNDNNNIISGIDNGSQRPTNKNEHWVPVKITSNSCAIYNVNYYPTKYYLGIDNKKIVGNTNADLSSQWEIIYFDVINVGTNRKINNVPSYIDHVYSCPLGPQLNLNDTFISGLNNKYLYNNLYKQLQITRTDSSFYASWKQNLLLPGINTKYFETTTSEFELVLKKANINIRQFLVYKDIYLACSTKGELCVTNGDQWILVPNSSITTYGTTGGIGGNMVMGVFNNKNVLFCVGPLINVPSDKTNKYGAIYYRTLDDITDSKSIWTLYSAQKDGSPITSFQYIDYCNKNQKLYSIMNGNLNELTHDGKTMTIRTNTSNQVPTTMFKIISLNYKGTFIVGINEKSYIYKNAVNLETNGLGPYEILANNTEITQIVVVHNIIFGLDKSSGKIYYVPLYGGIIQEYNSKLSGNLINIVGYNNLLYLVDNQSNVVKTQIIFE